VVASPIAPSLSPALHRTAYAELGLDWSYDAIEVDEESLPGFLAGLDESWAGLSLTMPLKRAVIPLLDELRPTATVARAVNTVLLVGGRKIGDNTDVGGMVAALRPALRRLGRLDRVAVLGGGATATSALAALARLGIAEAEVFVRSRQRAAAVREANTRIGVEVDLRRWGDAAEALTSDLLVSTTPAGATDSPLAACWAGAGGTVVGGLDLLVEQAALQVELMTDRRPAPLEAMRAAGKAALSSPLVSDRHSPRRRCR
jgi:shikimate dehydrogenase